MADLKWTGQELTGPGRSRWIFNDLTGWKWIGQGSVLEDVALA